MKLRKIQLTLALLVAALGSQALFAATEPANKSIIDTYAKGVENALKVAAAKPETGCNVMGTLAGRYLKTALVTPDNVALAQVYCCEDAKFKDKHPKAYESLCLGTSTNKVVEGLIGKVGVAPAKTCPVIGKLGRTLNSLTEDQKTTLCVTCGDLWKDKHPKAREVVCSHMQESAEDVLSEEDVIEAE